MTDSFPSPPEPPAPPVAPSGAYGVPVGGYTASVGDYAVPAPPRPPRTLGVLAFVCALLAAVALPVVAGVLALRIGMLVPIDDLITASGDFVIAALAPARTQTLWAEIAFWLATAAGLSAIILGIIAVARRRGRGFGIAALVIAVLGPGVFFLLVTVLYGLGYGLVFDSGL